MFNVFFLTACTNTASINNPNSSDRVLSLTSNAEASSKQNSLPLETIKLNPKTRWVKNSVQVSEIQKQNLESRMLHPKLNKEPSEEALYNESKLYNNYTDRAKRRDVAEAIHSGTQPKPFSMSRPNKVPDHQQTINAP